MASHPTKEPPSQRPVGQTVFLITAIGVAVVLIGGVTIWAQWQSGRSRGASGQDSGLTLEQIPFNGARAYEYLKQLCEIGPRPSGSPGMTRQQEMLAEHFKKLGGEVQFQRFQYRHPVDGSAVPIGNLIVHWHPDRKERILLCAHYDTLPYPMLDPVDPKGRFVGANDGASGTALLMEMAHVIPDLETRYGIDFVLFDAEEFIFAESDRYFVGSEHFATQYVNQPHPYRYKWGVLVDMIADADLQIYQETHSLSWPKTRSLVHQIWATARRLGVREFIHRPKYAIRDDHIPLNVIAGISTCVLIDFDYPPWHTQGDTPDKCSAESLAKVGWVLWEWLKEVR
ncbi:MAG: M28 family peptidase [Patescibacteria group bacterium]|nr:M28 family peptidase [Patescibacteria group bacterium]